MILRGTFHWKSKINFFSHRIRGDFSWIVSYYSLITNFWNVKFEINLANRGKERERLEYSQDRRLLYFCTADWWSSRHPILHGGPPRLRLLFWPSIIQLGCRSIMDLSHEDPSSNFATPPDFLLTQNHPWIPPPNPTLSFGISNLINTLRVSERERPALTAEGVWF